MSFESSFCMDRFQRGLFCILRRVYEKFLKRKQKRGVFELQIVLYYFDEVNIRQGNELSLDLIKFR